MSSETDHPRQRTVAELLAAHGGDSNVRPVVGGAAGPTSRTRRRTTPPAGDPSDRRSAPPREPRRAAPDNVAPQHEPGGRRRAGGESGFTADQRAPEQRPRRLMGRRRARSRRLGIGTVGRRPVGRPGPAGRRAPRDAAPGGGPSPRSRGMARHARPGTPTPEPQEPAPRRARRAAEDRDPTGAGRAAVGVARACPGRRRPGRNRAGRGRGMTAQAREPVEPQGTAHRRARAERARSRTRDPGSLGPRSWAEPEPEARRPGRAVPARRAAPWPIRSATVPTARCRAFDGRPNRTRPPHQPHPAAAQAPRAGADDELDGPTVGSGHDRLGGRRPAGSRRPAASEAGAGRLARTTSEVRHDPDGGPADRGRRRRRPAREALAPATRTGAGHPPADARSGGRRRSGHPGRAAADLRRPRRRRRGPTSRQGSTAGASAGTRPASSPRTTTGCAGQATLAPRRRRRSRHGGPAWAAVVAQWIAGAIGGAALWVGFRFLWRRPARRRDRRGRAGHRGARGRRPRAAAQQRPAHHALRGAGRPAAHGLPGGPRAARQMTDAARRPRRSPCPPPRSTPSPSRAAFELAAELGLRRRRADGVVRPASARTWPRWPRLAERYGVPVLAVHAPCLAVTQRVWGADPIGRIRRSVAAAADLGRRTVVLHPPFRWQRRYAGQFADEVARAGRARRGRARRREHVPGDPLRGAHRALQPGLRPHRGRPRALHARPVAHRGRGRRRARHARPDGRGAHPRPPRRRQWRPPRRAPRAGPRQPAVRGGVRAARRQPASAAWSSSRSARGAAAPATSGPRCSPSRCCSPGCTCSPRAHPAPRPPPVDAR